MTITATASQISYAGDGSTVAFTIPFVFDTSADIKVILTDEDGDPTEITTGFSITGGAGSTGTLTMDTAPAVGEVLTALDDPDLTQPTDYPDNDAFPASAHEAALDRTVRQVKRLHQRVERSLRVVDGDLSNGDDLLMPLTGARAGLYLAFDAEGNPVASAGTGGGDSALRTDLSRSTASSEGSRLVGHRNPGTGAVATSVYAVLRGLMTLEMFGAVGDGVADDTVAIRAAIDAVNAAGGGELVATRGGTYKVTEELLVKEGVRFNLNRATFNHSFGNNTDDCAFRLEDFTSIYDGVITVTGTGSPIAGRDAWACVVVGEGGASLTGRQGFEVHDLVVSSNRDDSVGGTGVLVQAGSFNFSVKRIHAPTSATLGSVVRVGWAGSGGNPPATSEHPFNFEVSEISFGTMTKSTGTFDIAAVDILGGYNGTIRNVRGDRWAGDAVVQIRTGGFGDTVAPASLVPVLFRATSVSQVTCLRCDGHGIIVNGKANDAVGTPSNTIPVRIEGCTLVGSGAANEGAALRILNAFDVIVENCEGSYFDRGLFIEEGAKRPKVRDSRFHHNNQLGVAVVHGTAPEDILLERVESYLNNQDNASHANFYLESCTNVTVRDCIAGASSGETATYGFRVLNTAVGTHMSGRNQVRGVAGGGTNYFFAALVTGDIQFFGGSNAQLATSGTEYAPLVGLGVSATEAAATVRVPKNMVITGFDAELLTAPGGAASRTLTVRDDGVDTTLDCTISAASTSGSDYSAVEVAAGSKLCMESVATGTPAAAYAKWSLQGFLS